MRYIGNKTKLLDFIRRTLRRRGIAGGRAIDPFTGTASVARALKRWGFHVVAADLMEYGHVFGHAYVQTAAVPDVSGLLDEIGDGARAGDERAAGAWPGTDGGRPEGRPAAGGHADGRRAQGGRAELKRVVAWLNGQPGRPGYIHRHFCPDGDVGAKFGRMYFTPENAARIDRVRDTVQRWRTDGRIGDDAFHVLLAALIEAADRVANTAGVYASFIKSWQPNALKPLRLRTPRLVPGNGCRAERADAAEIVAREGHVTLLYVDPPYNARQYPGYYHIPELLATGWYDDKPALRGKVGLAPDEAKRSDWARRGRCEGALETLLDAADADHVVMSYNSEGMIPEASIERLLRAWGRRGTYKLYRRRYRRYRADSDGEHRRYKGDEVEERLYCAARCPPMEALREGG